MIPCRKLRSMIPAIPLHVRFKQRLEKKTGKRLCKEICVCLSAAILSLTTGPFGKYQQLTGIIYGPV